MRKLVYYIATTIDRFIAHEDETMDGFVFEGQHIPDYLNSLSDYDAVLMGRRTFEWGYRYGAQPGQPSPTYAHMMQYVFSQTMDDSKHEQLRIIRDDIPSFVADLKQQQGKSIYLCGGGQLAGILLDHELIDELYLKVHPVAFGKGIPMFGDSQKGFGLSLNHSKLYCNGVMYINYTIRYH